MVRDEERLERERLENRVRKQYVEEEDLSAIENYIQDFLPIDEIIPYVDGEYIFKLKDGTYNSVFEITPINFSLLSPEDKKFIIDSFQLALRIPSIYKIQFKLVTKEADSKYLTNKIKKELSQETDKGAIEYGNSYIELIESIAQRQAVARQFIVSVEVNSRDFLSSYEKTEEEIFSELVSIKRSFQSYLSLAGNQIITPERGQEYAYNLELMYNLLNRRSSKHEDISSRITRVIDDQMKGLKYTGDLRKRPPLKSINDIIAPRGMDFRNKDYAMIDGLYYSFLYISGDRDGYPLEVGPGWVGNMLSFGIGIDVDIHMKKRDSSSAIGAISRVTARKRGDNSHLTEAHQNYYDVIDSLNAGGIINRALQDGDILYDVSILITVSARTREELERRIKKVQSDMVVSMFKVVRLNFLQKEAFLATLPLNLLDNFIYSKSRRNMLASTASYMYPFTAFELSDDDGIVFGVNAINGSIATLDVFNSKKYTNYNGLILGSSGSGKTFTMQVFATRLRLKNIQTIIVAPLKGHEFRSGAEAIGGSYIQIAAGSRHCINVFDVREPKLTEEELIDMENGGEDPRTPALVSKKEQLNTFFSLLLDNPTKPNLREAEEAVSEMYAEFGITDDNASLYNIRGVYKKMPTFSDLDKVLEMRIKQGFPNASYIREEIRIFIDGSLKSLNGQTNVDLDNDYVVLDISRLNKNNITTGMFIALDYSWDMIRSDVSKKKVIFLDEVWMLLSTTSANEYSAEFVREIFKTIRGYGGGAWAATQDIIDLFDMQGGEYGKALINNTSFKFLLKTQQDEIKTLNQFLGLSDAEQRQIQNAERGEVLMFAGNNKVPIHVVASETETEYFTTDVNERNLIAERRRRQAEREKALKMLEEKN